MASTFFGGGFFGGEFFYSPPAPGKADRKRKRQGLLTKKLIEDEQRQAAIRMALLTPLEQAATDLALDDDAEDDELLVKVLTLMVLH